MNDTERGELVKYKIVRAYETLSEVELLADNKKWNASVNRLYYACFYAVSALLISNNIIVKKHSGAKLMFGLNFVSKGIINKESGKFYTELFDMRQAGDYQDYLYYTEEEVLVLLQPARELIEQIAEVLSIK